MNRCQCVACNEPEVVERPVRGLVHSLNMVPCIYTTASCSGHMKKNGAISIPFISMQFPGLDEMRCFGRKMGWQLNPKDRSKIETRILRVDDGRYDSKVYMMVIMRKFFFLGPGAFGVLNISRRTDWDSRAKYPAANAYHKMKGARRVFSQNRETVQRISQEVCLVAKRCRRCRFNRLVKEELGYIHRCNHRTGKRYTYYVKQWSLAAKGYFKEAE